MATVTATRRPTATDDKTESYDADNAYDGGSRDHPPTIQSSTKQDSGARGSAHDRSPLCPLFRVHHELCNAHLNKNDKPNAIVVARIDNIPDPTRDSRQVIVRVDYNLTVEANVLLMMSPALDLLT